MYPGQQQQYQPPQFDPAEYQRRQDAEHLNHLAIFYFVMAGLAALAVVYFLLYAILGLAIGNIPDPNPRPGDPTPGMMGSIFSVIGVIGTLFCGVAVWMNIATGLGLQRRKSLGLIQVCAGLNCLNMPLGTLLGVFTFIVLSRPTVKALFDGYPLHPKEQNYYGGR